MKDFKLEIAQLLNSKINSLSVEEIYSMVEVPSNTTMGDYAFPCFKLAKENNKAIEVHACLFRKGTKHNDDGISPSYLRMLSVAKECGCKFFLGTDAHSVDGFLGTHAKLLKACDYLGIGEDDLWEVGRI